MLWLVLFSVGIAVALIPILSLGLEKASSSSLQEIFVRRSKAGNLSDSLQKWVIRAQKELSGPSFLRRSPIFLIIVCVLAIAGFVFGTFSMKNPAAGVMLAIAGVVFPEQVFYNREQMRREKILDQMGAAVRVFAAEYNETPHTARALGVAGEKLPNPIGGILRNAYKGFISGQDPDTVLIKLAKDLDNEYGRMFVQLLRLSLEDQAIKPLFSRLAARITSQQGLIHRNKTELTADRMLSVVLNIAIVPTYLIIRSAIPESHFFFTSTMIGKTLITLCIASAVCAAILDRLANKGGSYD